MKLFNIPLKNSDKMLMFSLALLFLFKRAEFTEREEYGGGQEDKIKKSSF